MGDIGGHEHDLASRCADCLTADSQFSRPINNVNESVEGRGVFAQALAGVEGEKRNRAGFIICQRSTYNSTFSVIRQLSDVVRLGRGQFGFCVGIIGHSYSVPY